MTTLKQHKTYTTKYAASFDNKFWNTCNLGPIHKSSAFKINSE